MSIEKQARQTAEDLRYRATLYHSEGSTWRETKETMLTAANQLEVLAGAYTTAADKTAWTPVADAMPESGKMVLVAVTDCYQKEGRKRILRAQYAGPKALEAGPDEEGVYDEEADTYYVEPGWYESNEFEEVHYNIDGTVTHWMPLPEGPK